MKLQIKTARQCTVPVMIGPQSIISLLTVPLGTGPVTQCARHNRNPGSALKHQNKQTKTEKDVTVEISWGNKGQSL